MAYPSDLVRTKDWGTEVLTDSDLEGQFDLIIAWVMAALNSSTGHKHDGTANEGPKLTSSGLDLTANYTFTGLMTFDSLEFPESASAPSTAASEGAIYTKDSGTQPELFYREESDGDEVQITSNGALVPASGSTLQMVNTTTTAVSTGTTAFPIDDTIPQNTEGDEYMTRAITPGNSSNLLKITVVVNGSSSTNEDCGIGLFQDSTAGALAAVSTYTNGGNSNQMTLVHYMAAGTTSSTTFKVRAGTAGGNTFTFNGFGGARKFGGVMSSSITIEEFKA